MSLRERLYAMAPGRLVAPIEGRELALAAARLALEEAARVAALHNGPGVYAADAIRALAEGLD